ncbi:MAG: substrate-binding domain-containing protein [Spirochaetales bacterium]|nr:substrate-binding domain-containing protein [Spirochaetales bacterium]
MGGFKSRIFLFILACLLGTPAFTAGRGDEQYTDIKILYVPGVADPFYESMEQGARTRALETGVSLTVAPYPGSWDPEVQIPILEKAASDGTYDLIMISPVDRDALIAPLEALYKQGIQIITVDTEIGDGNYTDQSQWSFPLSHIGTDNFAGAVSLAEHIAEKAGEKGKVYINTTTPLTSTTEERKLGFIEGISHFPELDVVRVDYNGDLQEVARQQTLNALIEHPDLVAVFATNVFSSQGVSAAVKDTGLSGAVKIAAWDSTRPLVKSLRNGEIDLVLAQKPGEIGALAVEWAYKYFIEEKKVPESITSGYIILDKSNINDPDMEQYIY